MSNPHIMIVEGRFYDDLSDHLLDGARAALDAAGATHEVFTVPGALEIASVIKMGARSLKYQGYVALGCVIRGDTSHYDIVCNESARALTLLALDQNLLIGNGILTCEDHVQALERARPERMDKGGFAARAVLELLDIQKRLRIGEIL
jgi:6,7-dimethyl-8-ribityllumazine synthase